MNALLRLLSLNGKTLMLLKRSKSTKENIKGFDLHNGTGRVNDTQVETSSIETVGAEESIFNFDNTALLSFNDTIGNIERANDFRFL